MNFRIRDIPGKIVDYFNNTIKQHVSTLKNIACGRFEGLRSKDFSLVTQGGKLCTVSKNSKSSTACHGNDDVENLKGKSREELGEIFSKNFDGQSIKTSYKSFKFECEPQCKSGFFWTNMIRNYTVATTVVKTIFQIYGSKPYQVLMKKSFLPL